MRQGRVHVHCWFVELSLATLLSTLALQEQSFGCLSLICEHRVSVTPLHSCLFTISLVLF